MRTAEKVEEKFDNLIVAMGALLQRQEGDSLEVILGQVLDAAEQIRKAVYPGVTDYHLNRVVAGKTALIPIRAGEVGDAFSGRGHSVRSSLRKKVNDYNERRAQDWAFNNGLRVAYSLNKWDLYSWLQGQPGSPKPVEYSTRLALVDERTGLVVAYGHAAAKLAKTSPTARLCVSVSPADRTTDD